MARYIDAEELKKRTYPFPCAIGVEYAVSVRQINETPTADVVEVKHGHWVDDEGRFVKFSERDGCPEYSCWCSICGKWLVASDEYPVTANYCPCCGAKMDSVPQKDEVNE